MASDISKQAARFHAELHAAAVASARRDYPAPGGDPGGAASEGLAALRRAKAIRDRYPLVDLNGAFFRALVYWPREQTKTL